MSASPGSIRPQPHTRCVPVPADLGKAVYFVIVRHGRRKASKLLGVTDETLQALAWDGLLAPKTIERVRARLEELGG